jgi:DNA-binding NtrC family response regulator
LVSAKRAVAESALLFGSKTSVLKAAARQIVNFVLDKTHISAELGQMPNRIVLVHDDLEFTSALQRSLRNAGYDVTAFEDSISAFDALRSAQCIEILVTQVLFRPGQPHGIALANAARMTRPSLKVIFTALPEVAHHAKDQGRVFIVPVHPDQIVQAIEEMLNTPPARDA